MEPGGPPPPTVDALERLTARSWRGLEEEQLRRLAAASGRRLHRAGQLGARRRRSTRPAATPPSPPSTEWYRRRGLRPQAQVPLPGAEAADAAFEAAGWERDDDVLVLTAALGDWPGPGTPVDLDPARTTAGWPATATAGPRCRPWPPTSSRAPSDPVFASVRPDPAPAPLAAVARGVLVDGLAVRHRRDRRRAATGGAGWPPR